MKRLLTTTITLAWLALLLILFGSFNAQAQIMRQVVIYQDTVVEFQKQGADEPNIPYGIDIHMWDSTGRTRIELIKTVKNNDLDGDTYFFDAATGLPSRKVHYKSGLQDGLSYYWNKKGELIRTEMWKRGKLISKQVFRK